MKHKEIIYRGLASKIFHLSKNTTPHVKPEQNDWVPIEPESLKRIYDDLVTEAGVDVLFGSFVADLIKNSEERVSAVIVTNKAGNTAYSAKIFIDATGDGDLCALAGADYSKGDKSDGPSTWNSRNYPMFLSLGERSLPIETFREVLA